MRERNLAEKGEIPTNEKDGKAESIPGNQASGIHEKSYSAVVKDPRKEKLPHKKEEQQLGRQPLRRKEANCGTEKGPGCQGSRKQCYWIITQGTTVRG